MSEQNAADATPDVPDTGTDTSPAPVDNAVMSRLDELSQNLAKLVPQEPAQQGFSDAIQQPAYDPYSDIPDEYADDEYGDQAQQPQFGMNELQQVIAQQVQQAMGPLVQDFRAQQTHAQATQLEQRYPDLAKPEVAGPLVQQSQQMAQQIGQAIGLNQQQVDALWRHPGLVETLFLAQRAGNAAAQETPADATSNVQLEGSAAQVEQEGTDNIMGRIAQAGGGNSTFQW